jgi:MEMO1 family protein
MTVEAGSRPAHVAGSFYPGSARELAAEVRDLLRSVDPPSVTAPLAALVVPHAGYAYSGPVAAVAYARLAAERPAPAHVAVLGPAHFAARRGAVLPASEAWETPLGPVQVDRTLRAAAVAEGAWVDDEPHATEHAVEVQLPFITTVLPGVPVLPVAVSDVDPDPVADLVEALAAVPGTLVIVSTDLSHYLDVVRARASDERTAAAIEARDDARIGPDDACGVFALRGLVRWAARHALPVRRLALATSADTAGEPERVVGYGAFALERPPDAGPRP